MPQEFSKEQHELEYLDKIIEVNPNYYLYFVLTGRSPSGYFISPQFSINTIKPLNYQIQADIDIEDYSKTYLFQNELTKKELIHKAIYLLNRTKIIQELKHISKVFNISNRTLFLCIEYIDKICEMINITTFEQIQSISMFCLILAAKFNEANGLGTLLEIKYKDILSNNFKKDELFILKLLNYNLKITTPYDLLIEIMNIGFIFKYENITNNKMNCIYPQLEKMILALVESKVYIELTHKQIALSIIGFVRESLKLEPFSKPLKYLYNLSEYEKTYMEGLNKIRRCFSVRHNNKHI